VPDVERPGDRACSGPLFRKRFFCGLAGARIENPDLRHSLAGMTKRFAALFVAVLAGASFAASPSFAVLGGTIPRPNDPLARATVAVRTLVGRSHAIGVAFCSGVLVSPDEVLTAGHCVRGDPLEAFVFAPSGKTGRLGRYAVASISRYRFPFGSSDQPDGPYATSITQLTFDTAFLRLSGRVPEARTVDIASDAYGLPDRLRLAGRGLSGNVVGALRTTILVPLAKTRSGLIVARSLRAEVCKGDSGSPVTADRSGRPLLFGVASAVLTSQRDCGYIVVVAPARPR
jgi:hypothetical protein